MTPSEQEAAFLRGELNVCSVCRTLQPIKAGQWCAACYREQRWAPFITRRPKRPSIWSAPPRAPKPPKPVKPPKPARQRVVRAQKKIVITGERPLSRTLLRLGTEEYEKMICRSYANVYKRKGVLKPQPCQRCGAGEVEMHHPDYNQPLKVEWLCRSCHKRHHAKVSRETSVG